MPRSHLLPHLSRVLLSQSRPAHGRSIRTFHCSVIEDRRHRPMIAQTESPLTGRQPFAAWVAARQSIDLSTRTELRCTLHAFVVHTDGTAQAVNGPAKGTLLRGLMTATVRREPERTEDLIGHLRSLEGTWLLALRQPSEDDREARIAHCVTPLVAAIVA